MAHSCHAYDLVLRRYLLALHHLLDYVRFVAAVVLDRLGIVSFDGEMLPGEPWSELVDTAPMERLMEAAFWQPSSPPKVNRSSSWTAPQYRRPRVAPADGEGAEDDDGCVGICAICLAALDGGGQLVTEIELDPLKSDQVRGGELLVYGDMCTLYRKKISNSTKSQKLLKIFLK
uniref:Uncharacterized protein n=1 Tax=Aegilops tauschii TaxID=37682 RepID=M8D2L6_AEGTA